MTYRDAYAPVTGGQEEAMGFFFTPLDQIMSSAGKVRLLRALSATAAPV